MTRDSNGGVDLLGVIFITLIIEVILVVLFVLIFDFFGRR